MIIYKIYDKQACCFYTDEFFDSPEKARDYLIGLGESLDDYFVYGYDTDYNFVFDKLAQEI